MLDKNNLYQKAGYYFPFLWKPMRLALWGKTNFNDLGEWEHFYTNISVDEIQKLNERIPNLVTAALKLSEPFERILDISAGFGNLITKISPDKYRAATEYSEKAIEYLESQGIHTRKAILPELPYEDESFDIVCAISVFEHLPDRKTVRASFEECHRVCKDGFLFSVPFECMEPWNTLIHNFIFSREDIISYTDGLFRMEGFQVLKDNITTRSVCLLRKI